MLTPAVSKDHTCDTLPPRPPAVIVTRRVPPAPCPTWHLTDVSDSQSVDSHPVCPCLDLTVCATSPMLDPRTVIDVDPPPWPLLRNTKLIDITSTDHTWLMLPLRTPTVNMASRVPDAP